MAHRITRLGENLKKSNILQKRKSQPLALSPFILIIVIALAGAASSLPQTAQSASTTTVYLDPPTINGTVVGQEFKVNINIRDAIDAYSWQAGLLFNNTVLNCAGFEWGEFLSDVAGALGTFQIEGTINNTVGEVVAYGETLLGPEEKASGDGTLISFTFTVLAPGVSDIHLRDVLVSERVGTDIRMVAANIIDVYTVVLNSTQNKVVTVSNTTDSTLEYHSGFSDHAFSQADEEISFKVTGPHPCFCEIAIPKTLLSVTTLDKLRVIVDSVPLGTQDRTVTENVTHYAVYFTYAAGIHDIDVASREILTSTISMTLSSTSIDLGSDVTIGGDIDPVRENATVTIRYRESGDVAWTTLATVKTDSNSHYSYTWTTETGGTYEIKATWAGDANTEGDESGVQTVTVKGAAAGIDPYILAAAAVGIIAVIAIVVYFVKIRKPEEE
jgi:hypothetical protein